MRGETTTSSTSSIPAGLCIRYGCRKSLRLAVPLRPLAVPRRRGHHTRPTGYVRGHVGPTGLGGRHGHRHFFHARLDSARRKRPAARFLRSSCGVEVTRPRRLSVAGGPRRARTSHSNDGACPVSLRTNGFWRSAGGVWHVHLADTGRKTRQRAVCGRRVGGWAMRPISTGCRWWSPRGVGIT